MCATRVECKIVFYGFWQVLKARQIPSFPSSYPVVHGLPLVVLCVLTLSLKPFVWRQLVCKLCDSAVYVKYCYVWLALGIPHIKCCHDVQKVAHKRISFLNVSINALVAPIMEQAFCNSWSCDLLSRTHWFSHW